MLEDDFDNIISLGSVCMTAYQIRRYFDVDAAQVFDWWVTSPLAMVEVLETDFSDLFRPDNMRIVHYVDRLRVMCSRYGLIHPHDFKYTEIDGILTPIINDDVLAANRNKYNYLRRRFRDLKGKVLFVRYGDSIVENYDRNFYFTDDLAKRFISAIGEMLPDVDAKLLLLNCHQKVACDHRIISEYVHPYGVMDWKGSDQGWNEMFSRLGVSRNRSVEEHSGDKLYRNRHEHVAAELD